MRIKNIGFWLVLFSIITLIFSPAIIYPFFQDDFFALVTTKITSLGDIWRLFLPVAEAVYWRPLGIQLYFGLMQFLGLGQPIWFHLVSLAVHLVNTYLVYRLVLAVGKNDRVAKLTAFLWGASPIHYFALGWAVNFSFILAVTWTILSVIAAGEGKNWRAVLLLVLGLMTNEIAIIIPGLVILAAGRKRLKTAMLMSVIAAIYLIWRLISGVKIQGDYELGLTTALSTLRWYGLWMLGWSDIVRDFIRWGVIFVPEFVRTFPAVVTVYLVEVVVLACCLLSRWQNLIIGRLLSAARISSTKFSSQPARRRVGWIIIGLLPVLFFQKHLYSHYAAVAAIGFYWRLAEAAVARGRDMLMAVMWIMVVLATMGLNYQVSWMADHAANSAKFQSMVREQMPKGRVSRIYIIVSGVSKAQTVLLSGYGIEYLTGVGRDKVIFVSSADEMPELMSDEAMIYL